LLASAFPGWAQSRSIEQPTPILSMTTTEFVEGRIGAVNQDSRIATVNLSDGRVVTGTVKQVPGGRGLLTAGDLIAASLEQRLSFVVAPESTAPPSDFESSGSEQLPPGVFTGQMIETWLVVGTNVADSTISLVRPHLGRPSDPAAGESGQQADRRECRVSAGPSKAQKLIVEPRSVRLYRHQIQPRRPGPQQRRRAGRFISLFQYREPMRRARRRACPELVEGPARFSCSSPHES
jgi:hypothetical protein